MSRINDITRLICAAILVSVLAGGSLCAQSGDLRSELREYLSGRVLVFRKLDIQGHQLRFKPSGQLLDEGPERSPSGLQAISFLNLQLDTERMTVSGEAVSIRKRGNERVYLKNPQKLELVVCTILLPVPAEQLTFTEAIRILLRIFLAREELDNRLAKIGRKGEVGLSPPAWHPRAGGRYRGPTRKIAFRDSFEAALQCLRMPRGGVDKRHVTNYN